VDALDNDNIIEDLFADFLFLFSIGVMHLISELIRSEFEKLGNSGYFFGELLKFPVDFDLEVNFSSG
jgi:hypothetical protein